MSKKETLVPESNLYREFHPGRWTVRRTQWFKNSIVGNPLVYTDNWAVSHYKDVQYFPTHAEAMAYADEEARTREVVLPRDTARPSEHLEIGPMYWGGAVVTTVDDGARLLLNPEEIRPLALALLAHAERMGQ